MRTLHQAYRELQAILPAYIVNQSELTDVCFVSLLAGGHILLVGPPGVAKTRSANVLAHALGLPYKRIQFTADLLPSDIVGAEIFDPKNREFIIKLGPIYSSFILADEINRAPPKVQSALLEAMQERQITLAWEQRKLPDMFFVVATMNPYDGVGTYTLPEATLDRFILSYELGYPSVDMEVAILSQSKEKWFPDAFCTEEELREWKRQSEEDVFVDEKILHYIARIMERVRGLSGDTLISGISTRAALALLACAKAYALIQGRDFVIPEDVKYLAPFILRHRITLTHASVARGMTVQECIRQILDIPVEHENS